MAKGKISKKQKEFLIRSKFSHPEKGNLPMPSQEDVKDSQKIKKGR